MGASPLCSGFRHHPKSCRHRRQRRKPSASRADGAAAPGVRTSRRRVATAQGKLTAQGRTGSVRASLGRAKASQRSVQARIPPAARSRGRSSRRLRGEVERGRRE